VAIFVVYRLGVRDEGLRRFTGWHTAATDRAGAT
jgi:hypothetical protein